jgi:hypothetical protein
VTHATAARVIHPGATALGTSGVKVEIDVPNGLMLTLNLKELDIRVPYG